MESKIVRDFQKLRVFTSRLGSVNMDELVQDLSFALAETSTISRTRSSDSLPALMTQAYKRQNKKRRSTKRRSAPAGRDSEASESSIDEALKDFIENGDVRSDSDEYPQTPRMPAFLQHNVISIVESDSLTENFSPLRPLRRRRKFKRMAVDACQEDEFAVPRARTLRPKRAKSRTKSDEESCSLEAMDDNEGTLTRKSPMETGKRKRTFKQSGSGSFDNEAGNGADETMSTHSSSSLSSSEADHDEARFTQDEAREADDEQSDFFHETGPACGVAGIIPWWDHKSRDHAHDDDDDDDEKTMSDPEFQKILTGSFMHMSTNTQRGFKARMNRFAESHGREIRYGRRRLNDKMPRYNMSRYIQDRQKWKESSLSHKYPPGWPALPSSSNTDTKRRRKTPPTSSGEVVTTPEPDPPIPETNIGNRMLQMMGWSSGSGLGPSGSGVRVPVMAVVRPRRQGLGFDMEDE